MDGERRMDGGRGFGEAGTGKLSYARIDAKTGFVITDSRIINLIHRGLVFIASDGVSGVNVASPKLWHVIVGSKELHAQLSFMTLDASAQVRLYRAPVFGAGSTVGVEVNWVCRNQNLEIPLLSRFCKDPDFGDGNIGEFLTLKGIPGGTSVTPFQRFGGESGVRSEWLLRKNTSYIFEVIPAMDDTTIFVEVIDAYEGDV